jgi:hypothetical protein
LVTYPAENGRLGRSLPAFHKAFHVPLIAPCLRERQTRCGNRNSLPQQCYSMMQKAGC